LIKDRDLRGAIQIYRQHVQAFTDKQIALLQNFAAQAVIAMENARLITETREALEQQTATAEVLGVINSSPGDLAPVFDAMLERAMRLCQAEVGLLTLREGEKFKVGAARSRWPEFVEFQGQQSYAVDRSTMTGRVALEARTVQITDVTTDTEYNQPESTVSGRVRSLLGVPLLREGAVVGTINLARERVEPFSESQISLLQNFADQAVIAMENARLIAETREALEQQTATAEVLQVINSSPGDLAPVFDAMLDRATTLCNATFGILWVYDGEWYRAAAFRNVPRAYAEFLRAPPPISAETPIGRIAAGETVVQIQDMAADQVMALESPLLQRSVELGGFRTILGVALRKENILFGAITILSPGSQPLHRQADRVIAELRRAGRHRDGKRAAHHRDARGAGTADRDRRGAGSDKLLAG
jgi:GAF domain-containing protein